MRSIYAFVQLALFKHFPQIYKTAYFFYKRISDRDKLKWMDDNIKEGMTVVDIGANIGFTCKYLSRLVGENGRVYSFEPDPLNFQRLKSNLANLKNVVLENMAVGEKEGTVKLYLSKKLNVDHQTYDSGEGREVIEINCTTIDSYFKDKKIDFVKIDIQGYDYWAIKGGSNTLKKKNISIIGEFWPFGLKKAGADPVEYINLLKQLGFEVSLEHKALETSNLENRDYYTDFIATKYE